jgi:hypothetical protein
MRRLGSRGDAVSQLRYGQSSPESRSWLVTGERALRRCPPAPAATRRSSSVSFPASRTQGQDVGDSTIQGRLNSHLSAELDDGA